MGTPYVQKLSSELQNINWSFCQLHMRSSYIGFGTGSLARDFEDISEAVGYLLENGKHQVVLMGHSTGCQNSIHYILNRSNAKNSPSVNGIVVRNPFFPELIFTSSKLL
jgi:pimeloyl-ACP methyl ester carboxylesterase